MSVSDQKLRAAYRDVFSGENGKLVLHDLMLRHDFFKTSAIAAEPYSTYFNEGGRAVVCYILGRMRHEIRDRPHEAINEYEQSIAEFQGQNTEQDR